MSTYKYSAPPPPAAARLRKPRRPFVAANHKSAEYDGVFRVLLISSGSVASVKIPDIVGALSRMQDVAEVGIQDSRIAVQVVATAASLHFYSQEAVDAAAWKAISGQPGPVGQEHSPSEDFGVPIWRDADEWSDWRAIGDPILHIELRRWADLIVVAPCSADFLAKVAGGLCDNLPLSVLRAITPDTPVVLCPAMNTHMYQHPLTADHLSVAQDKLGYHISGPQGAGTLACGDEGPGKMTDWRDIVVDIHNRAALFHAEGPSRSAQTSSSGMSTDKTIPPPVQYKVPDAPEFTFLWSRNWGATPEDPDISGGAYADAGVRLNRYNFTTCWDNGSFNSPNLSKHRLRCSICIVGNPVARLSNKFNTTIVPHDPYITSHMPAAKQRQARRQHSKEAHLSTPPQIDAG